MISESSREIAFQYSKGYLIYKLTIALLIYLLAVFYFLLAFIYSLISGIFLLGLDKFLITLVLGLAFWWSFSGISTYINSFNEFRVSEIGLRVKIFNFWFIWKDIAWIDIAMRQTELMYVS